jgi:sec-independent protein translocase protein TatA
MPFLGNHLIWVILLVIVLIIFGPGKLPQIGNAVGSALREFRKATNELKDEVARSTSDADNHPEPNKEATGAPKA